MRMLPVRIYRRLETGRDACLRTNQPLFDGDVSNAPVSINLSITASIVSGRAARQTMRPPVIAGVTRNVQVSMRSATTS